LEVGRRLGDGLRGSEAERDFLLAIARERGGGHDEDRAARRPAR